MTENDYQLAWAIYGVSALGCMLAWFYFTSWMWRYVREPLRLIVAVLLFVPTLVDPTGSLYAPALAITTMDLLFKGSNDMWRSIADLLMYGAMVFVVYALLIVVRVFIARKRPDKNQEDDEQSAEYNAPQRDVEPALTLQQMLDAEKETPSSGLIARR
ncbi:MAG TPA: MFS transporter [Thiopseudomonas sp.]|nr:MFS transporter [Thiopseudomonas sp.]